jgi:hypothetical protein
MISYRSGASTRRSSNEAAPKAVFQMRGYSLVPGDLRRGTARDIQAQCYQLLTERLQGHMTSVGGGAEGLRANNIKTRGDSPMRQYQGK